MMNNRKKGGGGGGGGGDDDHYFKVSPLTVNHDNTSGTQTVTVTSDLDWSVSGGEDWFTINKSSGSGNGIVVVTFKQNDGTDSRQSTLWFNADDFQVKVSVQQSAEEHHDVDGFDDYINAFSQYVTVPIDGITYNYLKELFDEAKAQFETDASISGIAAVHK